MYCRVCQREIDQTDRDRQQRCEAWKKAWKFLHWRGVVVGLYPTEGEEWGQPMVKPRRVFKELAQLPKAKLIDLDTYIPGFTRQQIKGMKATLKQLAPREL
jgi:hypothetical protein